MESNNIFLGMNSDIARLYQSNKEYIMAKNFRPVTTTGSSNGSLVNIKGNSCEITFPTLRSVYKFSIDKSFSGSLFNPGTITFTINGSTTAQIDITDAFTPSDVVEYIKALPNCYIDTFNLSYTFTVSYDDEYIYIYQNPVYQQCNIYQSIEPAITITQIGGTSTVKYVDNEGNLTSTPTAYITASSDRLVIIGSTFINDDTYLYTCGITNANSTGQIWKLTYNEATRISTIKLLYYNYINFSKEYPIPPTATTGRYEVPTVQRIYWTDFNNPVRSLNVADPNIFALNPKLLDSKPSVSLNIPTLKEIEQGAAVNPIKLMATYQCAYRLTKINGGVTNYSPLSNLVYPVNVQTDVDFKWTDAFFSSLEGTTIPSATANKAIHWQVDGVDTNYDNIEFVVVVRNYPSDDGYEVYKFDTQPINGIDSISTSFTNDTDNMEDISLAEFLIDNSSFTHAKTIDQKDNRLFYGNVKNVLSDYLDSFDTRTFRFNQSTNDISIKNYETDSGAHTHTIVDPDTDYDSISLEYDAIPVYNLGVEANDDANFNSNYRYQRNSTIVGGEGKYISYKFGTVCLRTDETPTNPVLQAVGDNNAGTNRDTGTETYLHGYRVPGGSFDSFDNGAPNQTYVNGATSATVVKNTMGLEYFSGNYKSYQHNEIYRFGIVFYGKSGNTYFVKWIGDIKFPNYTDPVAPGLGGTTSGGTSTATDFRSMIYDATGAYNNIPYIQFDVTIPQQLADLISGYEIVRVQRDVNDQTIADQGLITQTERFNNGAAVESWLPNPDTAGNNEQMDPTDTGLTYGSHPHIIAFHPFRPLADASAATVQNGDRVILAEAYGRTHWAAVWPFSTSSAAGVNIEEFYRIYKFYSQVHSYEFTSGGFEQLKVFHINEGLYLGTGESGTLDTYSVFNKHSSTSFAGFDANGPPTIFLSVSDASGDIIWENYSDGGNYVASDPSIPVDGNTKILALHYRPNKLVTQYGGRTYTARGNNEYISTGAYYQVTEPTTASIKAFGGDIYHGILDIHKAIKTGNSRTSPDLYFSQSWYFPCQSVYNVDLRTGDHTNNALHTEQATADALDVYGHGGHYAYENTLRKYIPKPSIFNETSTYFNRIYWTVPKVNGNTSDDWGSVPVNNYYDLDGGYGPITSLISLKDSMYAIQERAVARLLINQRSLVTDDLNLPLSLGSGNTLGGDERTGGHVYTNLDVGSKHQWSVYNSSNHITFVDANKRKIYLFNGQQAIPISDTKGQRGFVNKILHDDILFTDNPILFKGVLTTYDYANGEFLYTFLGRAANGELIQSEKYTLVFSELADSFTSFYDFTPYIYINNHNKLYSPRDYSSSSVSKLYQHNVGNYSTFYDTVYKSSVKTVINTHPTKTKVFDNLSWQSEAISDSSTYIDDIMTYLRDSNDIPLLNSTISRVRCYNEAQNSDWITIDQTAITGNMRKNEQGYNIQVPRNKFNYDTTAINTKSIFDSTALTKTSFGERMRDKYLVVDMEYPNTSNNRFILHNLNSSFRISDR